MTVSTPLIVAEENEKVVWARRASIFIIMALMHLKAARAIVPLDINKMQIASSPSFTFHNTFYSAIELEQIFDMNKRLIKN